MAENTSSGGQGSAEQNSRIADNDRTFINSTGWSNPAASTARTAGTPTANKNCVTPQQVFLAANSMAAFLADKLTQTELQTVINFLVMLETALSVIVTQQQICEGIIIQPPE